MGAWLTEQVATGKTADEAYGRALADATSYYGTQDGYSGAINSKDRGYLLVKLPARFTYKKFQSLLEDYDETSYEISDAASAVKDWQQGGFYNQSGKVRGWKGNLAKAERTLAKAKARRERLLRSVPSELTFSIDRLANNYHDKWGAPLAVEIRGAEAKRYSNLQRKRGERIFIFFGYAPS